MVDWTRSMQQTFEYYLVDPNTWKDTKKLDTVKSCKIDRDSEAETLGSATIDIEGNLGECYIRVYLVTIQNGVTEKHPLGTYLIQTPSSKMDGKTQSVSADAYTPLLELKENPPPLGYSILEGANIMEMAYSLTRDNVRAPVVKPSCDATLYYNFVANIQDTWLSFNRDLMSNAKYSYTLDEMGRILFAPQQDTASLQPVWTYDDGNSSILYPDLDLDRDIYGVPNVVEVIYSHGNGYYYSRVVNDDPNSPISTVNRGREITHRVTDPDLIGDPTKNQIEEYAEAHGIAFYNFLDVSEEIGIDYQIDTYDAGLHLNLDGAEKLSVYFARILAETHGVPDRRGETEVAAIYDEKLRLYDIAAAD